jgi:hypothetical protein
MTSIGTGVAGFGRTSKRPSKPHTIREFVVAPPENLQLAVAGAPGHREPQGAPRNCVGRSESKIADVPDPNRKDLPWTAFHRHPELNFARGSGVLRASVMLSHLIVRVSAAGGFPHGWVLADLPTPGISRPPHTQQIGDVLPAFPTIDELGCACNLCGLRFPLAPEFHASSFCGLHTCASAFAVSVSMDSVDRKFWHLVAIHAAPPRALEGTGRAPADLGSHSTSAR